eukprot:UN07961
MQTDIYTWRLIGKRIEAMSYICPLHCALLRENSSTVYSVNMKVVLGRHRKSTPTIPHTRITLLELMSYL